VGGLEAICEGDSTRLRAEVCNRGGALIDSGVIVIFRQADGDAELCRLVTEEPVPPGGCEPVECLAAVRAQGEFHALADPDGVVGECVEDKQHRLGRGVVPALRRRVAVHDDVRGPRPPAPSRPPGAGPEQTTFQLEQRMLHFPVNDSSNFGHSGRWHGSCNPTPAMGVIRRATLVELSAALVLATGCRGSASWARHRRSTLGTRSRPTAGPTRTRPTSPWPTRATATTPRSPTPPEEDADDGSVVEDADPEPEADVAPPEDAGPVCTYPAAPYEYRLGGTLEPMSWPGAVPVGGGAGVADLEAFHCDPEVRSVFVYVGNTW